MLLSLSFCISCCRCSPISPHTHSSAHAVLSPTSGVSQWAYPSFDVCTVENKGGGGVQQGKERGLERRKGRSCKALIMVMDDGEDDGWLLLSTLNPIHGTGSAERDSQESGDREVCVNTTESASWLVHIWMRTPGQQQLTACSFLVVKHQMSQ